MGRREDNGARAQLMIFDCDGVLVDSEPLAARVFAQVLEEVGLPSTVSDVERKFRGLSLADCIAMVERESGRSLPQDFERLLVVRTREAFEGRLRAIPGVMGVLEQLRNHSVRMCVASSGGPDKIRHSLRSTNLIQYFVEGGEPLLFSASDVPRGKPHPDLFLHAAQRLGVPAHSSAVVEDSAAGVRGAVSAGMTVFGFASEGVTSEHGRQLTALGATTFSEMSELPRLLSGHLGLLESAC